MVTQVVPSSGVDLFSDEVLAYPYPHYKALREAGPAVYLEPLDAWAVTRYSDVRATLRDWQSFTSRDGIAFNPIMNADTAGGLITSDGEEHDRLRAVITEKLRPDTVREHLPALERRAKEMVAALVERGSFDGVTDLARAYPSQVVAELLGLSSDASENIFRWGDASFTAVGPLNDRTNAAMPVLADLMAFMSGLTKDDFVEGSIGHSLYEAGERGLFPPEKCVQMLWNFTGAGADTTISSLGNLIWLLGENPDAWQKLRSDPALIPSACNEVLRFESPIQVWGRTTTREVEVDGTLVPAGARVAVALGSANRDERHYADADTFDVTRDPRDHISFGFGIHACVGNPLARAQMHSVLGALLNKVKSFEVSEPVRHLNNTVRGLENLPVTIVET